MRNPFDHSDGGRRWSIPMTILVAIGGLALAAVLALGFGWIVMLLWNWLMPEIFHLPIITYWQGWGLVLLSHILIKSGPGGHHHGHRGWGGPRHHHRGRGFKIHVEPEGDSPSGAEEKL